MDQPRIERLLRLMKMLSGSANYTVHEIAERLDTTHRTIYRYIDTLKEAGFVVERRYSGAYKLLRMPVSYVSLDKLVYFSEEEAKIVAGLIEGLDGNNVFKSHLYRKLAAIYDLTSLEEYTPNKMLITNIDNLKYAVENKKQVVLSQYESANSGNIRDRLVEPMGFSKNHIDVWAFDTESMSNKTFKIARIGGFVTIKDDWQFEDKHSMGYVDVFRMQSYHQTHVCLSMTLRAKNLLIEEFPQAKDDVRQDGDCWILDTMVSDMKGVGRFAIGLAEDVKIVDSPELTAYVKEYVSKNLLQ